VLCLAIWQLPSARAENGRDFAGQYVLSGPVVSNGTVTAMLTVRIFNFSGHNVLGARVLLAGSQTVLADGIGFNNHDRHVIHMLISVPSQEYAKWKHGPPLTVEWVGMDGALSQRPVELIRAVAISEVR
jgi:hypothetical protein